MPMHKKVVILVVLTTPIFRFSLPISQLMAKAIPVRGAKFKKPAFEQAFCFSVCPFACGLIIRSHRRDVCVAHPATDAPLRGTPAFSSLFPRRRLAERRFVEGA
ncbi:hypothetical protein BME05_15265 [Klebsiella quasipneumoniae subsp. quasipneumoniae]|nr:hypothetical protein BME05_15265 [Klebsiella quasipneumoniae subsp. quasipneumoniae]